MNFKFRKIFLTALVVSTALFSVKCGKTEKKETSKTEALTLEEVRAIAKEAYIYGYPMADSYRIEYNYFVDKQSPEYKAPANQIHNEANVFTPADKAIQTPNSDTPYSFLFLDLRAEPMVLTMPVIEKNRYFSVQLIDLYTFNFDYIGSRATGNNGGSFLVAGPNWKGEKPAGIEKVLLCDTELTLAVYRTQMFNAVDINNVKKIQAGYKVQPLSAFLGTTPPKAAPVVDFVKPITHDQEKNDLQIFNQINFLLQFCPIVPSEVELRARFAKIGIEAGKTFDPSTLSPEMEKAFKQGIADAWVEFQGQVKLMNEGKLTSGDVFGTREFLKNNYLYRFVATIGIYGNSKQEAMYPIYRVDSEGKPLSGANRYTLTFPKGELPPVNAFWSITMYNLPESLLVANPINRYLINSPMLPQLKKNADGGYTLYIQNESPGKDLEFNWLPAAKGPFAMYMRLYWPAQAALDGSWKSPKLIMVK